MVIQLDYCSNILKAINPGIGSILLFYHSCDHDRGREDGLNVKNMNSGYIRAQREVKPKNIKQGVGYLGPHEQIIDAVDEHHMVFQEGIDGLFCMTPQECIATKFSKY